MMLLTIEEDVFKRFECSLVNSCQSETSCTHSQFLLKLLDCYDSFQVKKLSLNEKSPSEVSNVELENYVCPECDEKLGSFDTLVNHFESEHPVSKDVSCTCGVYFDNVEKFLRHYPTCTNTHNPLIEDKDCEIVNCAETEIDSINDTYSEKNIDNDTPADSVVNTRPFTCNKCPKSFKSKPLLDQHMHIHFPPRYKCTWCGNLYRWPPVYYHHKQKCRMRPNSGPSQSDEASDSPMENFSMDFSSENNVPQSTNNDIFNSTRTNLLAYQALANMMSFNQQQLQTQAENFMSFNRPPIISAPTQPPNSVSCVCSTVLPDMPSFFEHVSKCVHFSNASASMNTNVVSSLASTLQAAGPLASLNFLNQSGLLRQDNFIKAEDLSNNILGNNNLKFKLEDPYFEKSRENSVTSEDSLHGLNLSQSHHNMSAPMPAPKKCTRSRIPRPSSMRKEFYAEITQVVDGPLCRKYFCRICGKEFTSKLSIKQHIDGKHTTQGKYVCSTCGKRYRWGASFYYHRRTCGQNGMMKQEPDCDIIDKSLSVPQIATS